MIARALGAIGSALLLLVGSQPAGAQEAAGPGGLVLVGVDGAPKSLTRAELAALPQSEVRVGEADSVQIFRGPTIRSLVTLVGAPTGHDLRGPSLLLAVMAECADGYKAAYMLAELDEQFGARDAVLALTRNGRPLPAGDGPLRIVMAGEVHHARWARQVVRLRLVRVGDAGP